MATAQSRVADKERLSYDVQHVALQKDSQLTHDRWKECAHLARQKADAERRADSCQAAQQEAEQSLRMAQLELARLKVCKHLYEKPSAVLLYVCAAWPTLLTASHLNASVGHDFNYACCNKTCFGMQASCVIYHSAISQTYTLQTALRKSSYAWGSS